MNNLEKACEKLDKLISDKLKDDTLKKLKTMLDLDRLRKAFDHWKNLRELKNILSKTKKNKTLGNTIKK